MTDTSVCVYHSFCEKVSVVNGEIFCFMSNISATHEKKTRQTSQINYPPLHFDEFLWSGFTVS